MLLSFFGTCSREARLSFSINGMVKLNVEQRKYVKGPVGDTNGIGAALREAVNDRFDRVPDEMRALLERLDRARRAA